MELRKKFGKLHGENPLKSYPVAITSYDIIMNDRKHLMKYKWKYLIVDEGHRIKNLKCKLIRWVQKRTYSKEQCWTFWNARLVVHKYTLSCISKYWRGNWCKNPSWKFPPRLCWNYSATSLLLHYLSMMLSMNNWILIVNYMACFL
jgi:hypothetical protein